MAAFHRLWPFTRYLPQLKQVMPSEPLCRTSRVPLLFRAKSPQRKKKYVSAASLPYWVYCCNSGGCLCWTPWRPEKPESKNSGGIQMWQLSCHSVDCFQFCQVPVLPLKWLPCKTANLVPGAQRRTSNRKLRHNKTNRGILKCFTYFVQVFTASLTVGLSLQARPAQQRKK